MKVDRLVPLPDQQTQFAWSHHKSVPDEPGCYVLATYGNDVLYVGLASKSIRDRIGAHLETPEKRAGGPQGVPFWLYHLRCSANEVNKIERGWMNAAILADGTMPFLNAIYSPT